MRDSTRVVIGPVANPVRTLSSATYSADLVTVGIGHDIGYEVDQIIIIR
jgi:hypothetical protein